MWIERILGDALKAAAEERPALVLTGARQTGKTSLLRHLFPAHKYVSLDLPSEAAIAELTPAEFIERRYPPPVVIDEVQYAPSLFRYMKRKIDQWRDLSGQFILTGSERFPLMQNVAESLAGRVALFELEPLSIHEIGRKPSTRVSEIVVRGGYPELYERPKLDSFSFYRSYIATYLERDVRNILQVGNLRDFERFLRACALRSGQLLNKADLARDVGISPSTANQWLSVLEASGQIRLLEPWFSNKTKSLVKSPKLYLTDTGLLAALVNIRTADELERSPLAGAIWETFVFSELRKHEVAQRGSWSIYFFNDRRREVDFVIDRGGQLELYEAKWTEVVSAADCENLEYLRGLAAGTVSRQAVICRTEARHPVTRTTFAMPVTELWAKRRAAR
jgi:predicted AAA+ superfamily ATPase